jgi:hypothetical protein
MCRAIARPKVAKALAELEQPAVLKILGSYPPQCLKRGNMT